MSDFGPSCLKVEAILAKLLILSRYLLAELQDQGHHVQCISTDIYNVASQTGPTLRRNYLSIFFSINSTAISSVTDNLIMEKILCADTILLIENVKAT